LSVADPLSALPMPAGVCRQKKGISSEASASWKNPLETAPRAGCEILSHFALCHVTARPADSCEFVVQIRQTDPPSTDQPCSSNRALPRNQGCRGRGKRFHG